MPIKTGIPFEMTVDGLNLLSNFVFDIRLVDQISFSEPLQKVLSSTNQTVQNGNGLVNTYQIALIDKKNRDVTKPSPSFDVALVENAQEWLKYDTQDYFEISEEMLFENDADFESQTSVNRFQAWNYKLLQTSSDFDLYKTVKNELTKVWGNNTVISGIDFSLDTMQDRVNNTMKIAGWVRNRASIYMNENTNLTEVANVVTAVDMNDLVLYVDSTIVTYMKLALGALYNPEYIRDTFKVAEIIEIPSNTGIIPVGATKPAMALCRRGKVAHMALFRTLSIVDAGHGLKNTFMHRKVGVGRFLTHAGESICFDSPAPVTPAKVDKKKPIAEISAA